MEEKVIDLYLGLAWELFSGFALSGLPPAWAIEKTEAAMQVWKEYEDRTYPLLAARATRPAPKSVWDKSDLTGLWDTRSGVEATVVFDRRKDQQCLTGWIGTWAAKWDSRGCCKMAGHMEGDLQRWDLVERAGMFIPAAVPEPPVPKPSPVTTHTHPVPGSDDPVVAGDHFVAPKPPPSPQPPFDFTGRWITRIGSLVSVIGTPKDLFPYANGVGSEVPGFGMFWNLNGLAVSPDTHKPEPEYDLMQRAPSPGGHRMDYPPEDLKKGD